MSYADAWNNTWKGPRPEGRTLLIIDGVDEEDVETIDCMETDEDYTVDASTVLEDIRLERDAWSSRALSGPSSELMDAMEMDIDMGSSSNLNVASKLVILDTNMLLSQLSLLKALVDRLGRGTQRDGLTVLVPGIVIQELDGLRNSNRTNQALTANGTKKSVGVSTLARQANDWLLPIINRSEVVRGQRMTESPRGNWMYDRAGLQNDDLILECAHYFARVNDLQPEHVTILTYDKNLQLKAGVEGYTCIGPQVAWSVEDLLSKLRGQAVSSRSSNHRSRSPDWANAPPVAKQKYAPPKEKKPPPAPSNVVPSMEVDKDPEPARPPHPLSVVQDQLRVYVIGELPGLVEHCVAQLEHARAKEAEEDSKRSIYAPKPIRPAAVPIPEEEVRAGWTPMESLAWLDKALPRDASTRHIPGGAAVKLAGLIAQYGEPGGRRGQDWTRGDWNVAADAMERFFSIVVVRQLRTAVEQAFLHLPIQ